MPELPEVETMVRGLGPRVEGATLHEVQAVDCVLEAELAQVRTPTQVRSLRRRGKFVLLHTDGGQTVVVHPRMTGRLMWGMPPDDARVRVVWRLSTGNMVLVDQRRLATVCVNEGSTLELPLGPEPLDGLDRLEEKLAESRMPIKVWLMDQRKLAGVGNIYASEICFRVGIDPRRPARSLADDERLQLCAAIPAVLREAIERQGTTLTDDGYRGPRGERGRFAEELNVYGREGALCVRCGGTVLRCVQSGRSTFFCPACQR